MFGVFIATLGGGIAGYFFAEFHVLSFLRSALVQLPDATNKVRSVPVLNVAADLH
jgi:hypothetical protein